MKVLLGILSILIVSACGTEINVDDKRTNESSAEINEDSFDLWQKGSIGIDLPNGVPSTARVKIGCNTKTDDGWKSGYYIGVVNNKKGGDTVRIKHSYGFKAAVNVSKCQAYIYEIDTLRFYKNNHTLPGNGSLLKGWAKR